MRRRDWVGFWLTMLGVVAITIPSPVKAEAQPAPHRIEQPKTKPDKVPWIQPGDVIIKDPHRLRDGHPYSNLPPMPERMKDPQAWA